MIIDTITPTHVTACLNGPDLHRLIMALESYQGSAGGDDQATHAEALASALQLAVDQQRQLTATEPTTTDATP